MQIDHSDTLYDIAIIGGGIAGTAIARDAALRGLSVVLLEKKLFGSGASGKSSKLIHGGIRYLELFWNELKRGHFSAANRSIGFVFSSLREERILRKIAPELIRPLSLIIPIYKHGRRKPLSIYFGVCLYTLLGLFSGNFCLPRLFFEKKSLLTALPGLRPEGLCGGVLIWDSRTDDAALVRATAASAKKNGALCFENAEVASFEHDKARERYAVSAWMPDGDTHRFFAKKLINASGPWIDKVRSLRGKLSDRYILPIAGSHIEIRKFLPNSVIFQASDGRIFFVINHGEIARIGTTEWPCPDPDKVAVPEKDIDYLLSSLSRYFLTRTFTREDILTADAGVRPLSANSGASDPNAISREHEVRIDAEGVVHVIGVKLTDHRRAAEDAVNRVLPGLMRPGLRKRSITAITPLDA
ncbi:MAG: hypothetical protein COT00_00490 [Candidatus Omnitrophica bacterium CG07_land_8_20_14_0_80_50_8]|nr:MAG: hypothetical protein COT00_00490 [Candidatus Omnitrophica bacterium CG07_land_8_20_14_0_80_50_8]